MAVLTPVERTSASFFAPIAAAFGALAGLFVGTAQGSGILGLLIGAAAVAAMAFVAPNLNNERMARWGIVIIVAVIGFFFAGIAGLIVGAAMGWFFGWLIFWLFESRYRQYLAPYLTPGQVLWHYTFRVICGAIFVFLITPIIVVMPLSFNAQDFFTFTPEMLALDPAGYSLKHYEDFFTSNDWQQALRNSLIVASSTTAISTVLGTSRT